MKPPVTFSNQENVAWKIPLPGQGCSTPIIVGDLIYVTCPDDDTSQDTLICLGRDGKQAWQKGFGDQIPGKHRNGSGSNASPTSDGSAVFVYFRSGNLAAVETDGTIRWQTNLIEKFGKPKLYWSHGTSPVLTKDNVIMAWMHGGDSWIAAFDKQTGAQVWKAARNFETPREGDHGYGTPLLIDFQDKPALLTWGAQHLTIHAADDGQLLYSCGGFNPDETPLWPTVASPAKAGKMVVVATGREDKRIPRLHGIELDPNQNNPSEPTTKHAWDRDDIGTFISTPAIIGDNVLVTSDRGLFELLDPTDGKTVWRHQLEKSRKHFYSSPLVINNTLYSIREDGTAFVCQLKADGLKVLSKNAMGESIVASPIPLGKNQLLIRTTKHLFCVGKPNQE
jgi:outer membrane protein assembly factor BamB